MSFKVGQKVVCVNGDFSMFPNIHELYQKLPKEAQTYTIRTVRPQGAEGGVLLEELRNKPIFFPTFQGKMEPAFHPQRFVPLEEFLDAISIEELEPEELVIKE